MKEQEYLSIKEVANKLSVAYLTVYRWVTSEKLRAYKAGKQYRIKNTDLNKFINRNK